MNNSKQSKVLAKITFVGVITTLVIGALISTLCLADPTSTTPSPKVHSTLSQTNAVPVPTNSVEPQASSPDTGNATVRKQLTGAELYSMNCNRCHQERYPTERTGAQWKTIMLHMQVRANIPVSQARLILQYLQDNSGR